MSAQRTGPAVHSQLPPCVINSQTAPTTGAGAARKTFGRKRHILVDTSGLILLAYIHAANLHDTVGARDMIEAAPMAVLPQLELVWADGACNGPFAKPPDNECIGA